MHTKTFYTTLLAGLLLVSSAQAEDGMAQMSGMSHGGDIYHMFRLETDLGASKNGAVASWDLDGWVGTDDNKLWLKSEGEHLDGKLETAEFWVLYSRNIATFWDAQFGLRYDNKPSSTTYAVIGFNGLAPYYFETEAHAFLSDEGDVTARIRNENDFLLTQKLILQPYVEFNLSAQNIPKLDLGAGLTDGQVGLQTRYEFSRKFAPYLDVHYGRKFGKTASIAENNNEDSDELVGAIGLRFMF